MIYRYRFSYVSRGYLDSDRNYFHSRKLTGKIGRVTMIGECCVPRISTSTRTKDRQNIRVVNSCKKFAVRKRQLTVIPALEKPATP